MPTYNLIQKETKKKIKMECTIAEMEEFVRKNPAYDVLCGAPLIHSGFRKTPSGFRDVLKQIKKNHRGSTIKV